jgi:predicted O-linked N-acetylglucosamine transferase (SPINDLY family)
MGVPVLTLPSDRIIQRTTASFLTAMGMPEFIAASEEDYIAKAVSFVTHERAHLATSRQECRQRLQASPIMTGYNDAVETVFRNLWREWCATQKEEHASEN